MTDEGDVSQNEQGAVPGSSEGERAQEEGRSQRQGVPGSHFREKPVKLDEELDVSITEASKRGDGVARVQGYVIFVPKCQQVRIKITMIRPNYAVAEIVQGSVTAP